MRFALYLGQPSLEEDLRTLTKLVAALFVSASLIGCSKAQTESEANGRALFQLHCAPCHDTPPPDLLKQPPKLNGLFTAKTLPSGAPATDEQVRKVVIEGLGTMPAFDRRLQEKDVRDLIAYLHTLK
jgi:mono/diheme cytochrome c family protein